MYSALSTYAMTCRLLAVGDHVGSLQAMPLTADQRRRRALYVAQWPAAEQGDHDVEQVGALGSQAQPNNTSMDNMCLCKLTGLLVSITVV